MPLNGSMFESHRPENGFPPPFAMDKTRLFGALRCSICTNNATEEDAVMTTEGRYVVPKTIPGIQFVAEIPASDTPADDVGPEGSNGVPEDSRSCICSKCSKELKDYRGRLAHERMCRA
jgi:hypothetical protein